MFAPTELHWGNLDNELRSSQPVLSWSIFTLERSTEAGWGELQVIVDLHKDRGGIF